MCRTIAADMHDPNPLMTLQYALDALKLRFGAGAVRSAGDAMTVDVLLPDRQDATPVNLTIEQAKFLVGHPMSANRLVAGAYHADLHVAERLRVNVPRPTERGALPEQFCWPLSTSLRAECARGATEPTPGHTRVEAFIRMSGDDVL